MDEIGKALSRAALHREAQAHHTETILPWPVWAAFFELYGHMQETYAQVGTTFGQEEEVEMLWDVFLTVLARKTNPALHHAEPNDQASMERSP